MAKKEKKKGSSFLTIFVTLLALIMVTLAIVLYAIINSNPKESQERYNPNLVEKEISTEKISIKINMESCMIPVGTSIPITATIYPNGSTSGVIWTSSDTNVITIDDKGILRAVGVGVAALTANFANVYDSIAVECVSSEDDAMLSLPLYSMFIGNTGNNESTSAESITSQQTLPNNFNNAESNNATNGINPNSGNNTQQTSPFENNSGAQQNATLPSNNGNQQNATSSANNGMPQSTTANNVPQSTTAKPNNSQVSTTQASTSSVQNTTEKPTKPPKTEPATIPTIPTTAPYEGVKVLSTEIVGNLPNYGFNKYLDNTYVYQENNAYLGEIIISSNMTHIYIKERSGDFDNAIAGVLGELLPESSSSVWNTYTTATSDQTVNVDGRVVRLVVPKDSGHSQIVIYN